MAQTGQPDAATMTLFVYGTLKEGFHNHEHYCRGVRSVEPAYTWGRLHVWEPGVPILAVPRREILLRGSADIPDDLLAVERLLSRRRQPLDLRRFRMRRWRRIQGQLLSFPDPERRLRILDALEGFNPATGRRAYERVLLPVKRTDPEPGQPPVLAAWCYVVPAGEKAPGEGLDLVSWEPGRA